MRLKDGGASTAAGIAVLQERMQACGEISAADAMAITDMNRSRLRALIDVMTYTCRVYEYKKNGEIYFGLLK